MGNPVTLAAELKDAVIEVNGHKHNLALVVSRAGSCPLIDVDVADIEIDAEFAKPFDLSVKDMSPVVYKHAGKLLVILGADHIRKAVEKNQPKFKARLLTSVALKSARIAEAQPSAPTPSNTPFNPPRWSDSNLRAHAGPGHERTRTADHLRSDQGRPQHSAPRTFSAGGPNSSTRQSFGKPSQPKKRFA